jgi:hypothetical protein
MLEQTGLFQVDVVTAPPAGGDFASFRPQFGRYQVVVLNYDAPDGRWPAALQQSFERYVKEGGGLVLVHAANNAFPGWVAFNEMAGIGGWGERDARAGPYWFLDADGKLISSASPGPTGSHGRRLPFRITVRAEHPVTAGSGHHEPQLLVVSHGLGRVFHTTLGHDLPAQSSVDFIVTFQRGTEWAATGMVRQAVPPDFPSPSAASSRALTTP